MVQMQKYMTAAKTVLDSSIVNTIAAPKVNKVKRSYADDRGSEKFIGDAWKKLPDGAIVRFEGYGYPSGMMRGTGARTRGFYKIRVTGYGHQTDKPITFLRWQVFLLTLELKNQFMVIIHFLPTKRQLLRFTLLWSRISWFQWNHME